MKKVKSLLTGLLVATGFALSPSLHAQMSTSGFYAGVGAGQAKANDACTGAAAVGITSCDDTDTAWRIFGGYRLYEYVAFEIGYADGGKYKASGVVLGVPASGEIKANAWDFVVVGILPFNKQFSAFGKLGFARWDIDASGSALGLSASVSDNGLSPTYGLGVQYDFAKQFGVRVEWLRYQDVGDENTTGQSDVDVIGASVLFKF
jgi:OOP family OmpA-OmpF porin